MHYSFMMQDLGNSRIRNNMTALQYNKLLIFFICQEKNLYISMIILYLMLAGTQLLTALQ